jgi:hypothetical protein
VAGYSSHLRDPEYFGQVHVDPEIGRITWLSGVDLAPEVLYERASAHPVATSRQATG